MKRTILIVIVIIFTATSFANNKWADNSCPISSCSFMSESASNVECTSIEDDGWILVGEISVYWHKNPSETIKVNLQIREVANRIIYRVEYHGHFYSVRKLMPNDDNDYRYCFTIDGRGYHFELQ